MNYKFKLFIGLIILFLFLGCKKKSTCKDVVQGDFELVETHGRVSPLPPINKMKS
jgi:hypothetical protein